jgi:hypothetical protein
MLTKFWLDNLYERDFSEVLGTHGRIILEWILGKYGVKVKTGFIWPRIGASGWVL